MNAKEFLNRFAEGARKFVGIDLSGANLSGVNLSDANLSGANLSGANLSGANLSGINLSDANLSSAILNGADLSGADLGAVNLMGAKLFEANLGRAKLLDAKLFDANLSRAKLFDANLGVADLRDVNLSGADLSNASLLHADVRTANLESACLSGAELGDTALIDVNLSSVAGLSEVRHRGPSAVSTSTLTLSRGRIPAKFLKGCGLADWEVENAKLYDPHLSAVQVSEILNRVHELRANSPIQFYSVFVSHSHADKEFARHLHDALQQHGIRCWLDERQLLPGDDIHDRIDHGIRLWDKVLLCASKESLTSWWVDAEIEKAFAKEQGLMRERAEKVFVLVPLALDDYLFTSWKSGKATQVRARMAGNFREWRTDSFNFDKAVDPLIRALRADGGGREPPPISRL